MNDYRALLSEGFNRRLEFREKRPGVIKLVAPLFHEDGDMIDIFLEPSGNGRIRIADHGLTLMRLSYTFDINTPNKERIFRQIIGENRVQEENGNLFVDAEPGSIYPSVLAFARAVAKISSMSLYRREVIASLFYEMLDEIVTRDFERFRPVSNAVPLPDRDELAVDYEMTAGSTPIYLFGARSGETPKVRLIAISCLEFQKAKLAFRSLVVHEDFDALAKRDRNIITRAADKQFTALDEFRADGAAVIERLAA